MPQPHFTNAILRRLDPSAIQRLQLAPVTFELGHKMEFPGSPIEHVFFLEEGMASMTTSFADGSQVEVGMFGYESVIGVSALMGSRRSLNHVYTQVAGWGYQAPVAASRAEFQRNERFQTLALRSVQIQLLQTAQSAGCNARHHMEQRLARWLLLTSDRVRSLDFKLPQEYIAGMLGNTRTTVSKAAITLKDEGLIEYTRGTIHILNKHGLEQRSCECYAVLRDHLNNFAEFEEDNGL